jgi:hypothetical protein
LALEGVSGYEQYIFPVKDTIMGDLGERYRDLDGLAFVIYEQSSASSVIKSPSTV